MEDISDLSDDELDALLIAQATKNWQKVAMVIARAMIKCETLNEDRVGGRIAALVDAGKLESAGNIHKWRFSEIRLPARA